MQKFDGDYYPETFLLALGSFGTPLKVFLTQKQLQTYIQLLDFLSDLCTCSSKGGCLKFNKGPWNNPNIMEGRSSSTWTIDYGSNIDNQVPKTIEHRHLAAVEKIFGTRSF
ncbi:phosphatidylinositol/phosphatidylcholine transfer protein SFH10-like isoform X2 [Zingiber officinale]|uniref:phosphatidylinositol/phosphatidylcholine transfer protein SFH10-like isoform X2 n=1 Tax=Zingiber officinale TaxID=94328 RepID=UPI001C4B74CE|nr:phosphatidylinositol/phosphatidylcholine transfer protein SFH10-like isoform X2 [Zingiber officinale]